VIPLFEQYPLLREKLAYVALGEFPTPVQKLERLGVESGIGQLYMKRDDLSGKLYGGNKPRKLEFILGGALRSQAKEIITFGCGRVESRVGHCHICATGRSEEHLDVDAPAERQVCAPQSAHEPPVWRRVTPVWDRVGIWSKYTAGLHCGHLPAAATQAGERPFSLLCSSRWFLRPRSCWSR
jgi:hypothetical protein